MSYIITDDKHYKNIAKSLRSKMQTDREYYPEDMAIAVDNIPSSADGTDNPVIGIYITNPDSEGKPTKVKISGWSLDNKENSFPIVFSDDFLRKVTYVEFINCDFKKVIDKQFCNCTNLTAITLPNTITSIGSYTFQYCTNLTAITLPNTITSIGSYTFDFCKSLTTITLPNTIISIGSSTFGNCTSLTTITLPNTIISIGSSTFGNCTSLKFVTIEDNFNCNNLNLSSSTLYTRETILQWLNALADRTGQTAYKLTIGAKNLEKLTEEDILIATNKNWTLA